MTGREAGKVPVAVDIDWCRAFVYTLGVVVAVTLLVAATTSTAAFGLFNPSWDGSTEFREAIDDDPATDGEVLREATEYETLPPTETTVFVIAPDEPYDDAAGDDVARFVESGGTLVVLDDSAESNALLEHVGSQVAFDERLVRDDRHHDRGPMMPTTTGVAEHDLTADVDQLTLNHATVLSLDADGPPLENDTTVASVPDDGSATPLVTTSEFAQLEAQPAGSGEGAPAASGPHAVATTETIGEGRVVAVADPSITINAMVDRSDNDEFLYALYADADRVAFDRSHGDDTPLIAGAIATVRQSPLLQALVGCVAIASVGLTTNRRVRRYAVAGRDRVVVFAGILAGVTISVHDRTRSRVTPAPALSPDEQAAYLRHRHPEWSEEKIDRAIEKFNQQDTKMTGSDQ